MNRNDVLSISVVLTKKWYSSFLKKVFLFQKICFKVKVLKTFETFTDCHIKHVDLSNGELVWKSLVPIFRRTYALSVGSKMKTLRKTFFDVKTKFNSSFTVKLLKKQPCIFTAYLMNHVFHTICTIIELKELNWLCKHMKNIRRNNEFLYWIKFFHVSIVKETFTTWKLSQYGVISGPITGKYGPEITQYLDTFHVVIKEVNWIL